MEVDFSNDEKIIKDITITDDTEITPIDVLFTDEDTIEIENENDTFFVDNESLKEEYKETVLIQFSFKNDYVESRLEEIVYFWGEMDQVNYDYTGVSANYYPDEAFYLFEDKEVSYEIEVTTINAYGTLVYFNKENCGKPSGNRKEQRIVDGKERFQVMFKCKNEEYEFITKITKTITPDFPLYSNYEYSTHLTDLNIKDSEINQYARAAYDSGKFQQNSPFGVIVK